MSTRDRAPTRPVGPNDEDRASWCPELRGIDIRTYVPDFPIDRLIYLVMRRARQGEMVTVGPIPGLVIAHHLARLQAMEEDR